MQGTVLIHIHEKKGSIACKEPFRQGSPARRLLLVLLLLLLLLGCCS